MILDRLENAERYLPMHPGFRAAFAWLRSARLKHLPTGKHAIDGDRLLVIIGRDPGRGRDGAKLEAHRKYIDIQYVFGGGDEIGWKPTDQCATIESPYDVKREIMFFADAPTAWVAVQPGEFVILYPSDAHAPLATTGEAAKAVMKVAVDWPAS